MPVPDEARDRALAQALAAPPLRLRPLDLPDGRRFWLKRVERLSGRLRLQKGDPARAFETERRALRTLADQGLPGALLVAEGPDWMLLADAGATLPAMLEAQGRSGAETARAFAAAGQALGRLHWAGLSHGRPAMRDICWNGQEARFIDMERFAPAPRGGWRQAADVVMLAQTWFTKWPGDPAPLDLLLEAYARSSPPGAAAAAGRLARRLQPLGALARGLGHLRPQSRELRAVSATLQHLRRWAERAAHQA